LATVALCAIGILALSTRSQAATPERALAGVKIFSPISVVVKKYGSPDEVKVGTSSTNSGTAGGGSTMGPGAGNGAMPPWMAGGGGGGGMPPWMTGGAPAANDSPDASGTPTQGLVTYIYDQNDSGTIEFTFSSDGHVIQIKATGFKGNVRTIKGITLGMNLADVIGRYGAPEASTIETGGILTMNYTDTYHTTFQLFNKKVVAIVVAAVE
jgi:hypothetical protein